jgi:hypothetical protein
VTGPGYYWMARRSQSRRDGQLAATEQLRA